MRTLDVSISDENRLIVKVYDDNLKGQVSILKGELARAELSKFYNRRPVTVSGLFLKNTDIIEYSDGTKIYLKNQDKILNSRNFYSVFKPIFFQIKKYNEYNTFNSSKRRKVNRKNKHPFKRIMAGGLALFALSGTIYLTSKTSKSDVSKEEIASLYKYDEYDKYVFEIMTNDKNKQYDDAQFLGQSEVVNTPLEYELSASDSFENMVSISYEDRTNDDKAVYASINYKDLIYKYARMYGLDEDLVLAMATQERGVHASYIDTGGGVGLMQIQNSVWNNKSIRAYNFNTQSWEEEVVTTKDFEDLERNIQIGCKILQNSMREMNYNTLAGLQNYNYGYGNMSKVLNAYCQDVGKDVKEVLSNPSDIGWLEYRNQDSIRGGDPIYIENVLSYYDRDLCDIVTFKPDGTCVNFKVANVQAQKMY